MGADPHHPGTAEYLNPHQPRALLHDINYVARCWADPREDDPLAVPATCLLFDGHAGAHEYTPDGEITVAFR